MGCTSAKIMRPTEKGQLQDQTFSDIDLKKQPIGHQEKPTLEGKEMDLEMSILQKNGSNGEIILNKNPSEMSMEEEGHKEQLNYLGFLKDFGLKLSSSKLDYSGAEKNEDRQLRNVSLDKNDELRRKLLLNQTFGNQQFLAPFFAQEQNHSSLKSMTETPEGDSTPKLFGSTDFSFVNPNQRNIKAIEDNILQVLQNKQIRQKYQSFLEETIVGQNILKSLNEKDQELASKQSLEEAQVSNADSLVQPLTPVNLVEQNQNFTPGIPEQCRSIEDHQSSAGEANLQKMLNPERKAKSSDKQEQALIEENQSSSQDESFRKDLESMAERGIQKQTKPRSRFSQFKKVQKKGQNSLHRKSSRSEKSDDQKPHFRVKHKSFNYTKMNKFSSMESITSLRSSASNISPFRKLSESKTSSKSNSVYKSPRKGKSVHHNSVDLLEYVKDPSIKGQFESDYLLGGSAQKSSFRKDQHKKTGRFVIISQQIAQGSRNSSNQRNKNTLNPQTQLKIKPLHPIQYRHRDSAATDKISKILERSHEDGSVRLDRDSQDKYSKNYYQANHFQLKSDLNISQTLKEIDAEQVHVTEDQIKQSSLNPGEKLDEIAHTSSGTSPRLTNFQIVANSIRKIHTPFGWQNISINRRHSAANKKMNFQDGFQSEEQIVLLPNTELGQDTNSKNIFNSSTLGQKDPLDNVQTNFRRARSKQSIVFLGLPHFASIVDQEVIGNNLHPNSIQPNNKLESSSRNIGNLQIQHINSQIEKANLNAQVGENEQAERVKTIFSQYLMRPVKVRVIRTRRFFKHDILHNLKNMAFSKNSDEDSGASAIQKPLNSSDIQKNDLSDSKIKPRFLAVQNLSPKAKKPYIQDFDYANAGDTVDLTACDFSIKSDKTTKTLASAISVSPRQCFQQPRVHRSSIFSAQGGTTPRPLGKTQASNRERKKSAFNFDLLPTENKELDTKYVKSVKHLHLDGNGNFQNSHIHYKRTKIDDYVIMKPIGSGGWSEVLMGIDTKDKNKTKYAMKVIDPLKLKSKLTSLNVETLLRAEIAVMKSLSHSNVISLREALEDPVSNKIYLILEYASKGAILSTQFWSKTLKKPPGEIQPEDKVLSIEKIRDYFHQMCRGLDYLVHNQANIVHHDIKPDNILVTSNDVIKFSDFGISQKIQKNDDTISTFNWGTRVYLPPESWQNKVVFGKALDTWALGCTLYQMVYGIHPFYTRQQKKKDLEKSIIEDIVNFPDYSQGRAVPLSCKQLMSLMLNKDPQSRITISQVLVHPFLEGFTQEDSSAKVNLDWRAAFSKSLIKRIDQKKLVRVQLK